MCFGLSMFINKEHAVYVSVDTGTCLWPHEAGEATTFRTYAAMRNWHTIKLYGRCWNTSSCNMKCSWSNTTSVINSSNLLRKVTIILHLLLLYFQLLFTSVSWPLHLLRKAFFYLTVYLMPYLLLSFWMCLAEINQFFPSACEQKFTIK